VIFRNTCLSLILAAGLAAPAFAQSSAPGYFMPPSQGSSAPEASGPRVSHVPAAAEAPAPAAAQPQQPQMPPPPKLPALPPAAPPPTAVIGVLSVPEVMQKSTAAQGVQAEIKHRADALAHDAQKARTEIQAEQAAIVAQRAKLTDAELEAKEQALRNKIAETQTQFAERNQAIQNSGQAALGQIESELIAIIRQEAEAHGMNLVLHREQVALNVQAFDITDDCAAQLNKLLPSVKVPPSVVTPGMAISQPDQGEPGDGQ
jgi:Skp family chaperone for outer membrane proteins